MRAAGCDHGIEKRFSMWGFICEPSPSMNRPFEYSWRSLATVAIDSGLRAKATAIPVPSSRCSVCSAGEQQREERVVSGLGAPDPRESGLFGLLAPSRRRLLLRNRCLRRPSRAHPNAGHGRHGPPSLR